MAWIDEKDRFSEYERCCALVDDTLNSYFAEARPYAKLLDSMRYSLLAGGKRIRATLCMKFCEAAGKDTAAALDAACAIEMLHAYSLIHDDLPCMDDDDFRRGKPSNHIMYGEATALLSGDALQAAAYETLLSARLPLAAVVEMGRMFAKAAGPSGICGGQFLDLDAVGRKVTQTELECMYSLKTASLLSASAGMGVLAAEGTREQLEAAKRYALNIGYAFQVRDDVLDCTAPTAQIGKPAGSDRDNGKTTFASLLGIAKCEEIIRDETDKAIMALDGEFDNVDFLTWFAHMLAGRSS